MLRYRARLRRPCRRRYRYEFQTSTEQRQSLRSPGQFRLVAPIWIDISAIGKITHPKNSLLQHDPDSDARLSYEELVILQRWLVARYQRSAFADEFNRRLRSTGVESGLKAISAKFGKYLRAVFFDVDEGRENERNGDKDAYDLVVTLLYDTDNDPEMAEAKAEEARQAIEKFFSEKCRQGWVWENIELRSCEVMADRALSFRDAQSFKEWRSEHVSLKARPAQPSLHGGAASR